MKNVRFNKAPLFNIDVAGIKLKVFRISGTPKIQRSSESGTEFEMMKDIHTHFAYEAFFVTEGDMKLVTEDGSGLYRETVVIIPPQIKHFSFPSSKKCYCLLFSFDESDSARRLKAKMGNGIITLPLTTAVSFYINRLCEVSEDNSGESEREAQLLTELIFCSVVNALLPEGRSPAPKSTSVSSHIEKIETVINDSLMKKLTLKDISVAVHLSTKQISRIIEREYGCGYAELLSSKRLAKAEMMLKNTDISISEIAESTFPGSESYFYILFKKKYGISPLKYRKESRIFEQ